MPKKNFWSNNITDPSNDLETSTDQVNYLLIKENEVLRKEINELRDQLHETKSTLSRIKMSLDIIQNILKDNVRDKIDFIREVINDIK